MTHTLSPIKKYQIKEVLFIISVFLAYSVYIFLTTEEMDDFPLLRAIIGGLCFGLLSSFFEIKLQPKLLRKYNFSLNILLGIVFYYLSFSILIYILTVFTEVYKLGNSIDIAFINAIYTLFTSELQFLFFDVFVLIFFIGMIREMRIMAGQNVLSNYMRGKYHRPRTEERFFMFLDLKSSTEFAEKLGHQKYSRFIKKFFLEFDEVVLLTNGIIYQYVGDEIVIIWDKKSGIKNNNVLNLYFMVEERFNLLKDNFIEEFGVYPEFKAGIHFGEVSIAEIGGILKKDIAYHGDPINTTSRICFKCKELNKQLLVSNDVLELLNLEGENFIFHDEGSHILKGKKKSVELFSVEKKQHLLGSE